MGIERIQDAAFSQKMSALTNATYVLTRNSQPVPIIGKSPDGIDDSDIGGGIA